jgi:hypothetical protein
VTASDSDVVVELPKSLRAALRDPLGPIYTDAEALLADAGDCIVTVGDIVTYHLVEAGRTPDVALVDERTKRTAVDAEIRDRVIGPEAGVTWFDERVTVSNPAATLTASLLETLRDGIERADTTAMIVIVDGEEDLAALPAITLAPAGATVVYGQPDEGMVSVTVDEETKAIARDFLDRMDGDHDRLWSLLGD